MKRRECLALIAALPLAGCVSGPGQFAKSDVDRIADLHRREAFASLGRLTEKLYRRNPREWKKGHHATLDAALAALRDPARYLLLDQDGRRSGTLILAALAESYPHDRVAAFMGGLAQMLHLTFEGKEEFFLLDDLDAQKLYNAARNVEIAAWKLANALRTVAEGDLPAGTPILLSNELTPVRNLSFEREFGRLIGSLDILSQIVADKSQRTVVKVVQNVATALFFPL